ncbi:hypothetical protein MASR1M50_25510 [Burkholderiales bacterium]
MAPSPMAMAWLGEQPIRLHVDSTVSRFMAPSQMSPQLCGWMRPGQAPVLDLQQVAAGEVQRQPVAQAVGEVGEAARHQQHLQPRRLAGQHQLGGAGVQAQAGAVDLRQLVDRHAPQQRHAAAQAVLEVGDLAAHGRLGDGGHLGLAAHGVGDLVHAFDVDQRRVHVEGDQPVVGQAQGRLDAAQHQAGADLAGVIGQLGEVHLLLIM